MKQLKTWVTMKKALILLAVMSVSGFIKGQALPSIDSLVIKLSIENKSENWSYTFSFSERGIRVQGSDYYSLYKEDDVIGYYFFDIDNSCIRNQQFIDLCSILRQLKKKRCPIATR